MSAAAVASYNAQRMEVTAVNPITATQIGLQMAHRILALLILCAVGVCAFKAWCSPVRWRAVGWLGLILVQAALGAWTIWSDKAADVATLHVLAGALSLVTGALLSLILFYGHQTKSDPAEFFATGATAPIKI
jgi:cytochrome c oxidase assembly protein subunit 15